MPEPPPQPPKPEQKRAAVRLRLTAQPAELWQLGEQVARRVGATLVNISEGGVALETTTPLELGASVYLRAQPARQLRVDTRAEVVRCEVPARGPVRLGLRFEGLPASRRDRLVAWIFAEQASRRRR